MVWVLASSKRRRKLSEDAESARASGLNMAAAVAVVVLYNIIGVLDIASTVIAIETGAGEEGNPVILMLMNHIGDYWMLTKLALQGVISVMVLWFPHWIVLGFFSLAIAGNAVVVLNNFAIAGLF